MSPSLRGVVPSITKGSHLASSKTITPHGERDNHESYISWSVCSHFPPNFTCRKVQQAAGTLWNVNVPALGGFFSKVPLAPWPKAAAASTDRAELAGMEGTKAQGRRTRQRTAAPGIRPGRAPPASCFRSCLLSYAGDRKARGTLGRKSKTKEGQRLRPVSPWPLGGTLRGWMEVGVRPAPAPSLGLRFPTFWAQWPSPCPPDGVHQPRPFPAHPGLGATLPPVASPGLGPPL